ncbi:MAG: RNA polymerase sigma factor [Bacteroidota bacterium]|nr:RNA polymerase sigma factor [Bacteroidota bacterium]
MEKLANEDLAQRMEALLIEYQDRLFKFAFLRLGTLSDAQDVVQTVLMRLYRNLKDREPIQDLPAYLFKSVANCCKDFRKRNSKYPLQTLENTSLEDLSAGEDASSSLLMAESFAQLKKLLDNLPDAQAETIHLRIIDDLSFTDIAGLLDLPVTTVKSRFRYGIDKLKSIVQTKNSFYELQ